MEIKTLAEILAEQNLLEQIATPDNRQQTANPHPPLASDYFEDDPSFTTQFDHPQSFSKRQNFNDRQNSSVSQRPSKSSNHKTLKHPIKKATKQTTKIKKATKSQPKKLPYQANVKEILQQVISENLTDANSQSHDHRYDHQHDNDQHNKNKDSDDNKSKQNTIDNLTAKLQQGLKTAEQRQAEIDDIKADSRLRWLAFYYLSTREHSSQELKEKLIAKNQNPKKIDALLAEFAEKGYQSDMRTALMLIREGIRKGRGRNRIKQDFYKRKIDLPANIDELIDLANEESQAFADFVDADTEEINWLQLAVTARVKKYGEAIPSENKDKAKQLRFLQYRGFESSICFEAIKHNLQSVADY